MNQTPKLDTDFVTIYENKIDSDHIINLIESVNKESYPFGYVMRRPHLTIEFPVVHHEKDNYAAIELRHTFNNILHGSLIDFLKRKNIKKMKQGSNIALNNNYITISKMKVGTPPMGVHTDLPEDSPLTDSFIVMFYVNDLSGVPTLGQTAWSRQIAYDADWVIALGRASNSDIIECAFRKNRNGFMGDFLVQVDFDKGYYRYKDYEDK